MKKRDENDDRNVARGATLFSNNKSRRKRRKSRRSSSKKIERPKLISRGDRNDENALIDFISNAGVKLSSYKRRYILRRLRVRMGRLKIKTYRDYLAYIKKTPEEIAEIQESLSINVTRFFRNKDTFERLKKEILPRIARNSRSIKIWSAGCAVGPEPYTLAMIASDAVPNDVSVSIHATDVKEELLRIARHGTYSEGYLAEMNESEKNRYFSRTASGDYKVKPHIKKLVTFNQHDLMKDDYPRNMDLIVCRNVLIYVDRKAQNTILNGFFRSINPAGYLVLGRTETLFGDWRSSVDIVSTKHRIYQKKEGKYQDVKYKETSYRRNKEKSYTKHQSDNSKDNRSNTDRLEELRDFRKTFEERKRAWEERLEQTKRKRNFDRHQRRSRQKTKRKISNRRKTRRSIRQTKSVKNEEIQKTKKSGSLSDYRSILKKSSEPTRISRVRRDLDD